MYNNITTKQINNVLYGCILLLISHILFMAPSFVRYALQILSLVCFFANFQYSNGNSLGVIAKLVLFIFFAVDIYLIVDFILDHGDMNWMSCLFNPFLIPVSISMLLLLRGTNYDEVDFLLSKSKYGLISAILVSLYSLKVGVSVVVMVLPFFIINCIYNNSIKRNVFILSISSVLVYWYVFVDENRTFFLLLVLLIIGCITSYMLPKLKKLLFFIYSTVVIAFPVLLFGFGISLFDVASYGAMEGDNNLFTDSRTFIYYETAETLVADNAVFSGLGLGGRINTALSDDLDLTVDKYGRRLFVESGFLEYFRRGGAIFGVPYLIILLISSYRLISRDDLLYNMIGFYVLSSCVTSLIGVTPQLSIQYIGLILCCSLGLSCNTDVNDIYFSKDNSIETDVKIN